MANVIERDEALVNLVMRSGSPNKEEALAAQMELAVALKLPLREALLAGDIVRGVYFPEQFPPGVTPEYPLDIIAPGEEDEHVAYTNPGVGLIAQRQVEGDYVTIATYSIASSIDWPLRIARNGGVGIVRRAFQALEYGFVKKLNDDGFHTLITAGADRNILVYDADASAGQLTKRLVSLMKTTMRRNAGGNTASANQGRLTDMFVSLEAIEDVRNWGVDQVDEITRHAIYMASDSSGELTHIFGVNLHELYELGEGAEYQNFFTDQLSGSLQASDTELVVGVDGANAADSFVMAIRQEVEIFNDEALHRQQRAGFYGWGEFGFGVLDTRRVLLGSL